MRACKNVNRVFICLLFTVSTNGSNVNNNIIGEHVGKMYNLLEKMLWMTHKSQTAYFLTDENDI